MSLGQKTRVAECLSALFRHSQKACLQGIECGGMVIVSKTLCDRRPDAEAVALKVPLVAMLSTLARQRTLRPQIMTYAMAKGLYNTWRVYWKTIDHPSFFGDVVNCIASYISVDVMRDELLIMDSYKLFQLGLSADCGLVRKNTVDLILAAAKYEEMADMFIEKKVLKWCEETFPLNFNSHYCHISSLRATSLVKHQDDPHRPSNWLPAIEAILAQNLPVKFALRGYLALTDRTQDNFYATHKIWRNPRSLHNIFVQGQCAPRRPILLCNFATRRDTVSNLALTSYLAVLTSTESQALKGNPPFNTRPYDRRLPEYLRILRDALEVICMLLADPLIAFKLRYRVSHK